MILFISDAAVQKAHPVWSQATHQQQYMTKWLSSVGLFHLSEDKVKSSKGWETM